ncbi:MAG TPA: tyrosine-type recombinase/integrase, partial [Brevibacterium sp.]|nr:tyrosine-type recombinase/integrase [Brevibacterium sp.]
SKKMRAEFVEVSAGRVTVSELSPAWLDAKRTRAKAAYMEDLETAWEVHVEPVWGESRVGDITPDQVQEWVNRLAQNRSASVVIRARGVLAGILDRAVRARKIVTNPARDESLELPRKKKAASRYLTHGEVDAISRAAGKISGQYEVLVCVLAYCGLRWGEATELRTSDIDLSRGRISVTRSVAITNKGFVVDTTKSEEFRSVPAPSFLVEALGKHITDNKLRGNDMLFVSRAHKHLRQPAKDADGKRWWESALDAAEVDYLRIHDLRHTAASLAVQSGASVKAIQRMLGHRSAALTLDTYADLFDTDLDTVAERIGAAREKFLAAQERREARSRAR